MLHSVFIAAILIEKYPKTKFNFGLCIGISVAILLAYFMLSRKKIPFERLSSKYIPFVVVAALATTFLTLEFNFDTVTSSASVALLFCMLPFGKWLKINQKIIQTAAYTGCFVGMCFPFTPFHYLFIFFASLVSGIIFVLSPNVLQGFGGKLGSTAFSGIAMITFLIYLFGLIWI
ncbi:hypothetical protein [Mesonia sp. K7]|uniref:hypothetical protein n=1 Tax=Mesonia sp. K7 TaxID=2218606 RepID=UPI000DAA61DD|nr:hypothetical protein [Mesonia sp. K7]PZD77317.1 hypothetical protein DNG35_09615 [Mesonia sp. K7]